MTKIASTVTQIIPEWIKSTAQLLIPEENTEEVEQQNENIIDGEREEELYPVAAEPSSSSSHSIPQASKSTYSVPRREDATNLEPKHDKRLSTIKIQRSEPKETSNPSRCPPIVGTTIEVDDDGSSSSDNTASSTSGCSSLVPSHQDNLQRLHLPKSSLDRLRQELMKTSDQYTRSSSASTKGEENSSRNSSALWTSRSGNREFDASKFLAPSSTIPFPTRTVTSPFYPGATKFGGASARRVEMLTSSPHNLNQRKLAPILRVKANDTTSNHSLASQDGMSSAARKILESMDRISSPLEEAIKMPLRGRPAASLNPRGPSYITSRLNLSQSLRPPSSITTTLGSFSKVAAVSTIILPSATSSSLINNNQPSITSRLNWNLSSVDSSAMTRPSNQEQNFSSSCITDGGNFSVPGGLGSTVRDGGGKMKQAKSSGRVSQHHKMSDDDVSNDVILNRIELPPIKTLPTFTFHPASDGKKKVQEQQKIQQEQEADDEEPVRKKKDPEQVVIKRNDDGKRNEDVKTMFSFSSPIVRSRHLQQQSTFSPGTNSGFEPNLAFKFSLPTTINNNNKILLPSSTLIPPSSLFLPSSKPLDDGAPEVTTTVISSSWGNKFKPAAGSWSCPCCMISNSADSSRCVACETVKP